MCGCKKTTVKQPSKLKQVIKNQAKPTNTTASSNASISNPAKRRIIFKRHF